VAVHRHCRRILAWLGSMRLAVILLILITIAAIVGGIVPQASITPNAEDLYRAYGTFWHRLITRLALDDVFHSAWFFALLSLFALNLVLCTARRARNSLRLAFGGEEYVGAAEDRASTLETDLEEPEVTDHVAHVLRRMGLRRVRQVTDPLSNRVQLIAHRFRWGVLGADLVHLGILIILVGGLLGVLRQEGTLNVNDRERGLRIPACSSIEDNDCVPLPFDVQVDDFGVEHYPESGRTKMFWAELSFWDGEELIKGGRTEINRPYSIQGVGFYPWRYGADLSSTEVRLHVVETEREIVISEVMLRVGEVGTLPDLDLQVTALRFYQALGLDAAGQPVDLGNVSGGTPAVLLQVDSVDGGGPSYRDLALPFLSETATRPTYSFLLVESRIPASMQIHFVRSPGYRVVWSGFLLIMIGLAGALYLAPTCFRLTIGDGKVMVIAETRKAKAQLGKLVDAIKDSLDHPEEV